MKNQKEIFYSPFTGQVVDENYPGAVRYVEAAPAGKRCELEIKITDHEKEKRRTDGHDGGGDEARRMAQEKI